MKIEIPKNIKKLMEELNLLVVGGCVRDSILARPVNDWDFTTPEDLSVLERKAKELGFQVKQAGKSFNVLYIRKGDEAYEIAQFRTESDYKGNKPKVKKTSSILEDSNRRDFTMNALYADSEGNVIDFHNGLEDISNKIVRFIGKSEDRIEEDSTRIYRAIRFSINFGFEIKNMNIPNNWFVPPKERILKELYKSESFSGFLSLSKKYGVIPFGLDKMVGLSQNPLYHPEGDVFNHTVLAVKTAEVLFQNEKDVWLGVIFHDWGKIETAVLNKETGFYNFFGHENFGKSLSLPLPKHLMNNIRNGIKHHMGLCFKKDRTKKAYRHCVMRWSELKDDVSNFVLKVIICDNPTDIENVKLMYFKGRILRNAFNKAMRENIIGKRHPNQLKADLYKEIFNGR